MNRWVETRTELMRDWFRMSRASLTYDPDIDGANLRRYTDARHPAHGGPVAYRIAFEHGDGPVKIITPSPRMLYFLMRGGVIRDIRVVGDDPTTGRPILEGEDRLLTPMTEREAVEFIRWRDVPAGCNRVEVITTADLPTNRAFRSAWSLA